MADMVDESNQQWKMNNKTIYANGIYRLYIYRTGEKHLKYRKTTHKTRIIIVYYDIDLKI